MTRQQSKRDISVKLSPFCNEDIDEFWSRDCAHHDEKYVILWELAFVSISPEYTPMKDYISKRKSSSFSTKDHPPSIIKD